MGWTGNPAVDLSIFVEWLFHFAFVLPFSVQFFFLPFTFGHLIYGSMLISVSVHVLSKIMKGDKTIRND